jgi:hypothetical protein
VQRGNGDLAPAPAIQSGTYQYAGGRVPSLVLPNGVTRTHTYDVLLRRTMVEYKQGAASRRKFECVYNLADYRILEKRHHSSGTGDNYSLDSLYRSVHVKAGVAGALRADRLPDERCDVGKLRPIRGDAHG